MKRLFFKPDYGWPADAIPYYDNGLFHIFYLLDYRNPEKHGEGTPWFKITTKDFVTYEDCGEMLARGTDKQYDMYVFTGSVFKDADGVYHIWYTGHNTRMVENYIQVVMHAVSRDLTHWEKVPEDTFGTLCGDYEIADWRDPFVWYDGESGVYKMLLSARKTSGPLNRRGATILLVSRDNKRWEIEKPFWQPDLYYAHECPDLFKIGDWYYHVFSEFSHRNLTRYVMSKSIDGPWIQPADDAFDGRAYYAAKTVCNGKDNYVIGWNPTREGESDAGRWQWGGALVVHKLLQRGDGTLACVMLETVENAFGGERELTFRDGDGTPVNRIAADTGWDCTAYYADTKAQETYLLDVEFTLGDCNSFGVLINADVRNDLSYGYILYPQNGKITFGRFPDFPQGDYDARGLERPAKLNAGRHRLKIIVEEGICVAYLDDDCALGARMYGKLTGVTGIMCQGKIEVNSIKIKTFKEKK